LLLALAVFLLLLGGGERTAFLGILRGRRRGRRRACGALDGRGLRPRRRRIAADPLAVGIIPALDLRLRRSGGKGEDEHEYQFAHKTPLTRQAAFGGQA